MDFLNRVKEYIEQNVTLNAPIVFGLLDSASSSVAIRQTPSSMNDRYTDGGKTFIFAFQVLVKDINHLTAYNVIQGIFNALDGLGKDAIPSQDGSYTFVKCECYTLPNFVEKTDKNEYIYTAIFHSELAKGGQ
jgi:Bacteriophage minor capsid protein